MDDLTQLESLANALPVEEKRELVQLLLSRLRDDGIDSFTLITPGSPVANP